MRKNNSFTITRKTDKNRPFIPSFMIICPVFPVFSVLFHPIFFGFSLVILPNEPIMLPSRNISIYCNLTALWYRGDMFFIFCFLIGLFAGEIISGIVMSER